MAIAKIERDGIEDGAIDTTKILDGILGTADIPNDSLTNTKFSNSAAIPTSKLTGLATSATTDTTNATNITSGSLATARVDVGTTAGKILQVDGSGNLPAVDGSLLTGVESFTKSASDPTVSTNPSTGVGTEWVNTTNGEIYICTDATAGANVWTNVGPGTGNIAPAYYGGETYGYVAGGQAGGVDWAPPHFVSNQISRFAFASGNASDFGSDLAVAVRYCAGASSSTHGYTVGGETTNHIQKFTMASSSNATDIGNATVSKEGSMGTNSETYGYHAGGYPYCNDIGRWSFASDGNATDWADLAANSGFAMACSDWDNDYGYVSTINTDQIQKFPFASQTNSVDTTQNLTLVVNHGGSNSSATHGYSAGGSNTSPHNHIDKFQFNTSNHATDVGNLATGRQYVGQTHPSSLTYGYSCCGTLSGGPSGGTNTIEKFSFSSDGNASDVGDLAESIYAPAYAQL